MAVFDWSKGKKNVRDGVSRTGAVVGRRRTTTGETIGAKYWTGRRKAEEIWGEIGECGAKLSD